MDTKMTSILGCVWIWLLRIWDKIHKIEHFFVFKFFFLSLWMFLWLLQLIHFQKYIPKKKEASLDFILRILYSYDKSLISYVSDKRVLGENYHLVDQREHVKRWYMNDQRTKQKSTNLASKWMFGRLTFGYIDILYFGFWTF